MFVDQLILEVGRKCNMACPHCLRGEAQDVEMSFENAKFIIDQFDGIGNITFTGGEPTLYADFICKVIDYIIDNNKDVYGFYIASNGLIVDTNLMLHLAKFYGYIEEFNGENFSAYEISNDHYHDELENPLYMLKGFSFIHFRGDIKEEWLIDEGRANDNGIGHRSLNHEAHFYFDGDTVEQVYLNAKGFLLPGCDYSYVTQDEMEPYDIEDVKTGKITLKEIFEVYNN